VSNTVSESRVKKFQALMEKNRIDAVMIDIMPAYNSYYQ